MKLNADASVNATFKTISYPLEVRATGSGEGRITSVPGNINCPSNACTVSFQFNTIVTLNAEAILGSEFQGWSGACEGTLSTCQVVLDRARTATATFRKLRFDVAITKEGTGNGTVRSEPGGIDCGTTCSATYDYGTTVRLVPSPQPTAFFGGWTGDCEATDDCVLQVDRAQAVTAKFTTIQHLVSVVRTEGGSVTSLPAGIACGEACSSLFDVDTQLTLTAVPAPTGRFAGWSGACTATADCLIAVTQPTSVAARFVFPLVVAKRGGGNGTIVSAPLGIACGSACSADFDPNVEVTLSAAPDVNSTFAGWSGACAGPTDTCTVVMREARNVTASFTKKTYSLVVNKVGTGNGLVTSAPTGIACGGDCAASFDSGTTLTLTASPVGASTFAGWSGACVGTEPCTLLIDRVRFVTATFSRITYPLTVNRSGAGTIVSEPTGLYCGTACSASFDAGALVTLTATADVGNTFVGWAGSCTGMGACSVPMNSPKTVLATFRRVVFQLGVSTGVGGGTVTSAPTGVYCGATCEATFDGNATVTLTATPDVTGVFAGWSGACSGTGGCQLTLDDDKLVTARFTFPLAVTRTGDGVGRVASDLPGVDCGGTCRAQYDNARVVRLTATPQPGSFFGGWSGHCTGTGDCTVTMTAARNVSASFTTGSFPLTVSKTGAGAGRVVSTPSGVDCGSACAGTFGAGATVVLTANADDSSTFGGWSGACTNAGATCSVTLDAAKTATATFNRRTYPLTVSRTGPGLVTADSGGIFCGGACAANYAAGTTVTLTATPNDGAQFTAWSGACTGALPTCTTTLDAVKNVGATFVIQSYALSLGRAGLGSGTLASTPTGIDCGATCSANYTHGTVVTLNASATTGSVFTGWSGASCAGTGACTVTMTSARAVTATFDRATFALTLARVGTGTGRITGNPGSFDCGSNCTASLANGTVVSLTATPDPTSTFAGWSGACSGPDVCAVTLNATKTVTATFTRRTYAVTVTNTSGGIVSSTPLGLYCGAACTTNFPAGEVVLLEADPDPNATFAGFSGACSSVEPCLLTVDAAKSVSARFTFPLRLEKRGDGRGRVLSSTAAVTLDCGATCAADVTAATQVTLTATPGTGSRFAGWGGPCEGVGACTVTMDDQKLVVATFAPDVLPVTVSRTGSGAGRVTSAPMGIDCGSGGGTPSAENCMADFPTGTAITLSAAPDGSSRFAGWAGACEGSLTSCTLGVTEARAIVATFTRTTSALTVVRAGTAASGGTVTSTPNGLYCGATCSASFDTGSVVTLTATSDATTVFASWSGGGCSGNSACSVTLDAARSVTATFNRLTVPLAVTLAGTGQGVVASSVSGIDCGLSCNAVFNAGTVVSLTAAPNAISTFTSWSGACVGAGACTITMSQSQAVTATFTRRNFDVSVSVNGNGAGTVSSSASGINACTGNCTANASYYCTFG